MGSYSDVPTGHWAYDYIEAVTELGWVHGYSDGTFRPEEKVDRDEAATMLYNVANTLDLLEPPPPIDTTPPVITLLGDNPMAVFRGHPYVEPGWVATDDTDQSVNVTVEGEVDSAILGSYALEYTATDSAGNFSFVVRAVEVIEPSPLPEYDAILEPGDNLQAKVDQAGEAASIGVAPGVFNNAGVKARAGQLVSLVSPLEETEWNGAGRSYGLQGLAVPGVVIRGYGKWTLKNYGTPKYRGVIDTFSAGDWYGNPTIHDNGWDVDGVIIRDASYGVTLFGHGARLTNFELHNIGTLGFSMRFHHDMYVGQGLMRHIGFNNVHGSWGHEGGGSKSWETLRLVHEDLDIEDVKGPGVWTDHGNLDTVYRRIHARDTSAAAIFHEISGWCEIDDCIIREQPPSGGNSIWSRGGAGITIANAKARINNTRLTDMETGIAFLDQSRGGWSNTTEGVVRDCVLDDAGKSGAGNDHGGPKPNVDFDSTNQLINGSTWS